MKDDYKLTIKPIDNAKWWQKVIRAKDKFPSLHILLRMVLALTPSNAAVEQTFSRLSMLLGKQRLRLRTKIVEANLIVARDTVPWEQYDCEPVYAAMASSAKRESFQKSRSDKDGKHRAYSSLCWSKGAICTQRHKPNPCASQSSQAYVPPPNREGSSSSETSDTSSLDLTSDEDSD